MAALADLMQHRLARFVIVGAGCAALLAILTFALLQVGAPPFAGGLAAYGLTFVVAYLLQRNWSFRSQAAHSRTLPRYFLLQAGCALTAGGLSHLLAGVLGWPHALAAGVLTVCVSVVSYVVSSLWVFADDRLR